MDICDSLLGSVSVRFKAIHATPRSLSESPPALRVSIDGMEGQLRGQTGRLSLRTVPYTMSQTI